MKNTSFDSSNKWYNQCVGEKGHYYHATLILKNVIHLLDIHKGSSILDVGCGQGVLSRRLPKDVLYTGIDLSKHLIAEAKKSTKGTFLIKDACKPLDFENESFDRACFILSLQNMQKPNLAIEHVAKVLKTNGKLIIVLNHPCFRIPRQSGWGVDEKTKVQYRRMNVYLSEQEIPIQTHPSKGGKSSITYSFHHPLSSYVSWLTQQGLLISGMYEWCSDKKSEGSKAKMENRARKEFPLFLCLVCEKIRAI